MISTAYPLPRQEDQEQRHVPSRNGPVRRGDYLAANDTDSPHLAHSTGVTGYCDPCLLWHYLSQLRLVRTPTNLLAYRCADHRQGCEIIPRPDFRITAPYRPRPVAEPLPRTDYLGRPVVAETPPPATRMEEANRRADVLREQRRSFLSRFTGRF